MLVQYFIILARPLPLGGGKDLFYTSFQTSYTQTMIVLSVFAIAEVAKKLIMDRIVNEKIVILVDYQAAILAIQNNIVKSHTALPCIKNLNILGKDDDVTIAWTPGHTGI